MKRFDRDKEDALLNKPAITEVGAGFVELAKRTYSDRFYDGTDVNLRITWASCENFRAAAFLTPSKDHLIRLSYGTAIEIHRDAMVFALACEHELQHSSYDPIFKILDYGNDRKDVLPADMETTDVRIQMTEIMTAWLLLHEQAHLLQRHFEIASSKGVQDVSTHGLGIDDVPETVSQVKDEEAAIRHCFELAADYEAISSLLTVEIARDISPSRFWCMSASLMILLLRFYEEGHRSFDELPLGTHPHPSIRMRMMRRRIIMLASQLEKDGRNTWMKDSSKIEAIFEHAATCVELFWQHRYRDLTQNEGVDSVLRPDEIPMSYKIAVFNCWKELRPEILEGHLGWGEGVLMFLKSPDSVGRQFI